MAFINVGNIPPSRSALAGEQTGGGFSQGAFAGVQQGMQNREAREAGAVKVILDMWQNSSPEMKKLIVSSPGWSKSTVPILQKFNIPLLQDPSGVMRLPDTLDPQQAQILNQRIDASLQILQKTGGAPTPATMGMLSQAGMDWPMQEEALEPGAPQTMMAPGGGEQLTQRAESLPATIAKPREFQSPAEVAAEAQLWEMNKWGAEQQWKQKEHELAWEKHKLEWFKALKDQDKEIQTGWKAYDTNITTIAKELSNITVPRDAAVRVRDAMSTYMAFVQSLKGDEAGQNVKKMATTRIVDLLLGQLETMSQGGDPDAENFKQIMLNFLNDGQVIDSLPPQYAMKVMTELLSTGEYILIQNRQTKEQIFIPKPRRSWMFGSKPQLPSPWEEVQTGGPAR